MKFKFSAILFSIFFFGGILLAKELTLDSKFLIRNLSETILNNSQALKFEVNQSVLKEVFTSDFDEVKVKNFPLVGSKTVDMTLQRAFIPFDQNTEFYIGKNGQLLKTKAPQLITLTGTIDGNSNSFVFLSLTDFGGLGTVQGGEGELYSIAPNLFTKNSEHILTNINTQVADVNNIFKCFTEDYSGNSSEGEDLIKFYKQDDVPLAKKPLLEVKLACEGTADFYKIFNNEQKAMAYIASVIAQSSKIYQEFFNVRLYIGYVVVWTDEWDDPYYGTQNLSEKLNKMPSIWRNKSIDRALTVLFANLASQPANETVAGISYGGTPYYGSLCNKDWGYCVLGIRGNATYPTLNYTWDVNVATHEMGHNFSLPHTHNCYWQPNMIDTCVTGETYGVGDACIKTGNPIPRPGTIMSYCHLTNSTHSVQLIFHPRQWPLARSAAERSNCVKQVSSPYVSLLNPLGDKTYVAGQNLEIRWTSAYVNYLTIFYSTDKGASWNLVADNVPATDSIYVWQLPNVKTNLALVYIRDKSNPNVADTSMKTFSILPKAISILSPSEGEEFAVGESIMLSWNATLVDTFNVYFSTDGGTNYKPLITNYVGNYYELIAPQIQSDECKFKVTSIDGKIVSESAKFKVGTPICTITFPTGGEVFCVNSTYSIKWMASYINKIVLEYSTDNGDSWKKVSLGNLDAKLGAYLWKVPNRISKECLIRIRPTFTENAIAVTPATFEIDTCQTIGGVVNEQDTEGKVIRNIEWNPDENELLVEFEDIENLSNPSLLIYDVLGRMKYFEVLNSNTISNKRTSLKLSGVSEGILFVILKFDGGSRIVSTVIIR